MLYVFVVVGVIVTEPLVFPPVEKLVPLQRVARAEVQEIKTELPAVTVVGETVKSTLGSGGGGGSLTVTVSEAVAVVHEP